MAVLPDLAEVDRGRPQFDDLFALVKPQLSDADAAMLERAYEYAATAHTGQFRKSGEPYILHPIATARALVEIQFIDIETLAAALLHDVIEDTGRTFEDLEGEFGTKVARLVDGVTKLGKTASRVTQTDENSAAARLERDKAAQAENLRKMVLAMAEDVRVVLIKLADRLHNMRSAPLADEEKQRRKATETMEIYAPLANRLGIRQFKSELEDLAFKNLEPRYYEDVKRRREEYITDLGGQLEVIVGDLRAALADAGIKAEITWRMKHMYSIYRKMLRKEQNFEEIYDVVGIRVIVEEKQDCYGALGVIHAKWPYIPSEFDDYIGRPKDSMYQSLHTAVLVGATHLEVQIRTWEMHRVAEYGIAAHWRYKESGKIDAGVEAKIAWLRQLMEWRNEVDDPQEFVDSLKSDVFREMIYVFTPGGDVIDLPRGATPIDFAYRIHTEVGHSCVAATVDGKMVPLNFQLENAQVVRIQTSKTKPGPSRDWLNPANNYVATAGAREKIRQWFRRQRRDENIAQGRKQIEDELQRLGLGMRIDEVAKRFPAYLRTDDFLAAIGYGVVTTGQIAAELSKTPLPDVLQPTKAAPTKPMSARFQITGVGDLYTTLATCCKPVRGDEIIGFITRGRGVTVHRVDCPNILKITEPERLMPLSWDSGGEKTLTPVQINLGAWDRVGLLRDVTSVAADQRINIIQVLTNTHADRSVTIAMTIEVADLAQLHHILNRFEQIRDVYEARRVGGDNADLLAASGEMVGRN
ncbi:MAG: bifunctional (p)ppGpp synthetase/guanosine-3',5'-bis(diphosphate) 3'-pyrophosphohydrolase [Thermomicrobiales bacterium]